VPQRDPYFYYGQDGPAKEMVSIIFDRWKLIIAGSDISKGVTAENHLTLYDVRKDPNEKQDVAADHREFMQTLTAKLTAFRNLQLPNAIAPLQCQSRGLPPAEGVEDRKAVTSTRRRGRHIRFAKPIASAQSRRYHETRIVVA
jgi:hypothetical protein